MAPNNDELKEKVMVRAQALFTAYTLKADSLEKALMEACVQQAKIEFADEARLRAEGKI